jgi:hypothetical protein
VRTRVFYIPMRPTNRRPAEQRDAGRRGSPASDPQGRPVRLNRDRLERAVNGVEAPLEGPARQQCPHGHNRLVEACPPFLERNADRRVVAARRPGPSPAEIRPPDKTSNPARTLASAAGPRTTGFATVVNSPASPEQDTTAARAVGPSSHGTPNTMWSLTETASKPSAVAVSTYSTRCSTANRWSPKSISGRWTPNLTTSAHHAVAYQPTGLRRRYEPRAAPCGVSHSRRCNAGLSTSAARTCAASAATRSPSLPRWA